ncbi:Lysophospholipase L1 [Butyrivibrio hungatei]|uniref:Lysophospholipase L1 n=1 Tax=Butyrivibrio hungatei TaxID=185008 RepID=A0A1G5AAB9_9FIRM|nr:SGNH/GDSL hydrolase family protein [Butyrivibrio hungatei]SCX74834.1 Lysophospholipase L1 [Butyrivibrio hungatei]
MVLTNEELKVIYFGTYEFEETDDGYLQAFQYSKKQIEYFKGALEMWYERCTASTAKTLEFRTSANKLSFDYKIIWKGSPDSFEIMVDGLVSGIKYVKDIMDVGTIEWELPEGEKNVVIYLPADATVLIKNFAIDAKIVPAVKGEKVLWLGDSITQGYGPLRSSNTYVSVANRILNYDIINQGIGGYVYDKNSLMKMEGYNPDKIIVALGTNQYGDDDMSVVEEYYETLIGIYGKEIPILCITPLWRGDSVDGLPVLMDFCEKVRNIAGQHKNVKIVDGMKMIPHFPEYFLDNLHPNCLGCEIYGRNLVDEIKRIGF